MEREILKYLYKFYKDGDYLNFHSLIPLFDKFEKGENYKYFLEKIRSELSVLQGKNFIEIDSIEYNSWSTDKEAPVLFDYKNNPVSSKITPQGRDVIEKVLSDERQEKLTNSVKTTNSVSKFNVLASLILE
ncbi:MAG: hypothetical protein IPJ81_08970 [Chitinophagaceae bacterium]|nr:hypothetical protein [Chitinophagaceae bacterium]